MGFETNENENRTENRATDRLLDIDAVQQKLAGKSGRHYWRSLEEISDTPEFQAWVEDEFPNRKSLLELNRRDLLKFMGASMALAGLTGCRGVFLPQDKVIPYVKQPEELVPGVPLFYASSIPIHGYGVGVLVEQHEGRPTKLEGNPLHPASLGASSSFVQAEILNLYDPDRARSVIFKGDISTWEAFSRESKKMLGAAKGIAVLTQGITSPTLLLQLQKFKDKYNAKWFRYQPADRANVINGSLMSCGQPLEPVYDFSAAKVIVSLDGSFLSLEEEPAALKYAREFASRRRVIGKTGEMNRVYAFDSFPSLVSSIADHRWPILSSEVPKVAAALAAALGLPVNSTLPEGVSQEHFQAMVDDLRNAGGEAVVVAGPHQSPEVHGLVAAINSALGSQAVKYVPTAEGSFAAGTIAELSVGLASEQLDTVIILGGNPVFDAPADLNFADALGKAKHVIYLGQDLNETSAVAEWSLPMTHPLEEWGDLRAQDGTVSIIQPLIAPLFEGRSAIEFVSALNGQPVSGYDVLRSTWQTAGLPGVGDFEVRWRDFVHDGVLRGSAFAPINAKFNPVQPPISSGNGIEINFRPDPTIFDGRYANNGWLQELPKTVTKLTWDNAAIMSPSTAKELGVTHEDMIEITVGDVKAKVGVFLQPGVAKNSITLYFGYGRTVGGAIATAKQNGGEYDAKEGGGVNVFPIRMTTGMNSVIVSKESIKKVDGRTQLISTQGHNPLPTDRITDERDILRETTLAQFVRDPEELEPSYAFPKEEIAPNNLYVEEVFEWNGEQWGMTIDLNTCTGCNACVTACQAENNIPVVGKQQVANGREMHWIRIDRYYSGSDDNPQMTWQPLMCVHCEKAPCEPVCPVAATVHSHDGLNQMIYNRCVGTRYCSNNCPYKVRRFNYLNYTDNQPNFMTKVRPISALLGNTTEERQNGIQLLKMINNPNVTVRGRGIMEKCTYCVQRINNARIESKKTGKDIKDGEIVTACEQACPTSSITFGNIRDKASRVAKLRNDPRAWLLLEEYQTRPRTSHLAKLRNPNPVIEPVPAPKPKRQKHGEEHGEEHGAESHGSEHESTENHTHDESTHSETSPQTQEAGGAH